MPEMPTPPTDGADVVPEAELGARHDTEQASADVVVEADIAASAVVVDDDASHVASREHAIEAPACSPPAAV